MWIVLKLCKDGFNRCLEICGVCLQKLKLEASIEGQTPVEAYASQAKATKCLTVVKWQAGGWEDKWSNEVFTVAIAEGHLNFVGKAKSGHRALRIRIWIKMVTRDISCQLLTWSSINKLSREAEIAV
jgi:hypothetical protein